MHKSYMPRGKRFQPLYYTAQSHFVVTHFSRLNNRGSALFALLLRLSVQDSVNPQGINYLTKNLLLFAFSFVVRASSTSKKQQIFAFLRNVSMMVCKTQKKLRPICYKSKNAILPTVKTIKPIQTRGCSLPWRLFTQIDVEAMVIARKTFLKVLPANL